MHKRVKVCIRVRPASKDHAGIQMNAKDKKTISVLNEPNGNGTCFRFDDVLGSDATQEQVYQRVAAEAVDSVLHGYNGTVMAYGQTGAGKTFTMTGGKTSFSDRGICARAISRLFQAVQTDNDHTYSVRVSYVEIYNEQLYDLLDFTDTSAAGGGGKEQLVVQENDKGQTFVRGLSKPIVENEGAALDLLFQGETNRTIAEHCLNNASTRSHCIFSLHVEKRPHEETNGTNVSSKLNLVDLAGSERMKKTQVTGTMLKETTHINKSLTFLEQVVIALGDHKREHIPYRQTTLTNLLKDSLGGNCRTLLIACVWPDESQNDQTIATLKFATRMMRVKTSAVVNVAQEQNQQVKRYQDEIRRLKLELVLHDTLAGRSFVSYDPISVEQERDMADAISKYIADESNVLPVGNVVHVQTTFRLFREAVVAIQSQRTNVRKDQEEPQHDSVITPLSSLQAPLCPSHENIVEENDSQQTNSTSLLDEFKHHVEQQLETAKQNFRQAKKRVVQAATDVNVAKSEIDALTKELATATEIEQTQLVSQLKEAKKKYRLAFDVLNEVKAEMNYLKTTKDQLLASAATDFETW
ncbi:Kinesin-like protein kif9 [Aphanomyces cochlioides]|nr:Kinesin-like protein kif9 [Aphanomyces cochlioides]